MPSQELLDLRAKITELTDDVLDAIAQGEERDKSEVVREVLHSWALLKQVSIERTAASLKRRLKARESAGTAEGLQRE